MSLIARMATAMGVPTSYIRNVAKGASHCYKTYAIPKRSGGSRTIHHPSKRLKPLQRWLASEAISDWPVHPSANAYRKGRSIKDNAEVHINSRFLLRMDLANFFPSIRDNDVAMFLSGKSGWTEEDIDLFTSLVCRDGRLTIGAASSPSLSNALCFDLDARLSALADGHAVAYSRYADDFFFSTNAENVLSGIPQKVKEILASLRCPAGLCVNDEKTRHSSKRACRRVTGLVLGSDGRISVGRRLKRDIRSQLYRAGELDADERRRLGGLITYVNSIEPGFINRLILKYGHATVEGVLHSS